MIAGTRQSNVGGTAYRRDPLYAYAKAFTEAASSIMQESAYDIFAEPKALRSNNPCNVIRATLNGLSLLRNAEEVAETRGKTVKEILG